jgi:tetratricopeptide (TPR) repeat protein
MCAYYGSKADGAFDVAASARMLRLAVRLSDGVTEPERMLIRYGWADATNSPARLAVAESLAARYPAWPQAELAAGQALWMAGDPLAAAPHLRRVIAADSAWSTASGRDCPACTAAYLLVNAYRVADSLPAAVRSARAWVRASPRSRNAWLELANALAVSGRYEEARAALDSSTSHAAGERDDPIGRAQIEIRAGNFHVADGLLGAMAMTGEADSRLDALWWTVISLRDQGRLREALALARGSMRSAEAATNLPPGGALVAEGQVLFERGRFREAAVAFERRADLPLEPASPGALARQRAWFLTQAGSALAGGGDTLALASLADTVQAWGRMSGLGRDRRLHEYLRGLLWEARGRPEEAVAAFRRAMISPTEGFSRLDLELANVLLALHRPGEAIPVLQSALAGSMEGGNFYVSRTELQERLARAFEAAGQPDSAVVYYGRVARAWQAADSPFQPRVAHARGRIALHQRHLLARR